MELDELREHLDAIDARMVAILSERARIVAQVAEIKKQRHMPVYIPEREAAIIQRLRTINPGPLSGGAIERIYRAIIEEMRNFENEHVVS
jgi:chorismate mutase / prephenate dehydratase